MDYLVEPDIGALRYRTIFNQLINGIILKAGYEIDSGAIPLIKHIEVIISLINRHNAARGQSKMAGDFHIVSLAGSNHGEIRQVAVVVEKKMQFHRPFRLAEISPGEQTQAEIDGRRIQTQELVFETEFSLFYQGSPADSYQEPEKTVFQKADRVGEHWHRQEYSWEEPGVNPDDRACRR